MDDTASRARALLELHTGETARPAIVAGAAIGAGGNLGDAVQPLDEAVSVGEAPPERWWPAAAARRRPARWTSR